jgi:hypothetical protein
MTMSEGVVALAKGLLIDGIRKGVHVQTVGGAEAIAA